VIFPVIILFSASTVVCQHYRSLNVECTVSAKIKIENMIRKHSKINSDINIFKICFQAA